MQDKFHSFSSFFSRTDALAAKLGVKMREIPAKLRISERMLYGYRSGKYPVTAKAWAALERAERANGIFFDGSEEAGNAVKSSDPKETTGPADQFPDAGKMIGEVEMLRGEIAEKNRQIERLLGIIERQAAALDGRKED